MCVCLGVSEQTTETQLSSLSHSLSAGIFGGGATLSAVVTSRVGRYYTVDADYYREYFFLALFAFLHK